MSYNKDNQKYFVLQRMHSIAFLVHFFKSFPCIAHTLEKLAKYVRKEEPQSVQTNSNETKLELISIFSISSFGTCQKLPFHFYSFSLVSFWLYLYENSGH